jgi:hypothetical protein
MPTRQDVPAPISVFFRGVRWRRGWQLPWVGSLRGGYAFWGFSSEDLLVSLAVAAGGFFGLV